MIHEVALFVTDIGAAAVARSMGSAVSRIPPRTLFPTADQALGLNGELLTFLERNSREFENVPEMSDAAWSAFLNRRFPARRWDRWFGKTASAIYSVVVVHG